MIKPSLFIILPRVPYPLEKGDKLRAYHIIKGLKKEFHIHLFALQHEPIDQSTRDEIAEICDTYDFVKTSWLRIFFNTFLNIFNGKPFQVGYFFHSGLKRKIHRAVQEENHTWRF